MELSWEDGTAEGEIRCGGAAARDGWTIGRLAAWLLGCLAAWLLGGSAARLLGCLAAWLAGDSLGGLRSYSMLFSVIV